MPVQPFLDKLVSGHAIDLSEGKNDKPVLVSSLKICREVPSWSHCCPQCRHEEASLAAGFLEHTVFVSPWSHQQSHHACQCNPEPPAANHVLMHVSEHTNTHLSSQPYAHDAWLNKHTQTSLLEKAHLPKPGLMQKRHKYKTSFGTPAGMFICLMKWVQNNDGARRCI